MTHETPGENVERMLRTLADPEPCRNCAERGRAMRRALQHADHLQQVADHYEERLAQQRVYIEAIAIIAFPAWVWGAIELGRRFIEVWGR